MKLKVTKQPFSLFSNKSYKPSLLYYNILMNKYQAYRHRAEADEHGGGVVGGTQLVIDGVKNRKEWLNITAH